MASAISAMISLQRLIELYPIVLKSTSGSDGTPLKVIVCPSVYVSADTETIAFKLNKAAL
jgi:hypothetical protein